MMKALEKRNSKTVPFQAGVAILSVMTGFGCARKAEPPPNFVIIFTDDQGYNDLSCYGATHVNTPNIDRMAEEGIRLTSFYVAGPLSSPSRSALMTGSYPKRIGLAEGSRFIVLLSNDKWGLNPEEITIAELLKTKGYATGIFGKWHLGDAPEFLPTKQGFDEFFGLPYSHDIHPYHPRQKFFHFPSLPLYEGDTVIELDPDADYLTQRITKKAVDFIVRHRDEPFFLYIPHPMPHMPLHVSPPYMKEVSDSIIEILKKENRDIDYQTRKALFPQVIKELDWSVGEVLRTLEENGLNERTFIFFATDNGPFVGSAFPLRGKKGSTYEGGMRVPGIMRWPGHIPPGQVSDELVTAMDILPTFAYLSGASVPDDRIIDGSNIWPILAGEEGAVSPYEKFFYHRRDKLVAVRSGKWKLHRDGATGLELYNLKEDISESRNVAEDHPDVVERLMEYMEAFDREMSDPSMTRPVGTTEPKSNQP